VLSDAQMSEFAERGYIVVPRVVAGDMLDKAAQRIAGITAADPPAEDKRGAYFYFLETKEEPALIAPLTSSPAFSLAEDLAGRGALELPPVPLRPDPEAGLADAASRGAGLGTKGVPARTTKHDESACGRCHGSGNACQSRLAATTGLVLFPCASGASMGRTGTWLIFAGAWCTACSIDDRYGAGTHVGSTRGSSRWQADQCVLCRSSHRRMASSGGPSARELDSMVAGSDPGRVDA